MPGLRRAAAGLSLAAILMAVCLPGLAGFDCLPVEFEWVLVPDEVLVFVACAATPCDEQPVALLAPAAPRGPPARPVL
jgi:hypothetical protein